MNTVYEKSGFIWRGENRLIEVDGDELRVSYDCPRDLISLVDAVVREYGSRELKGIISALEEKFQNQDEVRLAYISLDIPLESVKSLHRAIIPTLELLGLTYNTLNNTHISIAYTVGSLKIETFDKLMNDLSQFKFQIVPTGIIITRGTNHRMSVEIPKALKGNENLSGQRLVEILNTLVFPRHNQNQDSVVPLLKKADRHNYKFVLSESGREILLNDGNQVLSLREGKWSVTLSEVAGFDYLAIELQYTNEFQEVIDEIESNITLSKLNQFQGGFKFHISLFEIPSGVLSDEQIGELSTVIETCGINLSPSVKLKGESISAYNSNRELIDKRKVA